MLAVNKRKRTYGTCCDEGVGGVGVGGHPMDIPTTLAVVEPAPMSTNMTYYGEQGMDKMDVEEAKRQKVNVMEGSGIHLGSLIELGTTEDTIVDGHCTSEMA